MFRTLGRRWLFEPCLVLTVSWHRKQACFPPPLPEPNKSCRNFYSYSLNRVLLSSTRFCNGILSYWLELPLMILKARKLTQLRISYPNGQPPLYCCVELHADFVLLPFLWFNSAISVLKALHHVNVILICSTLRLRLETRKAFAMLLSEKPRTQYIQFVLFSWMRTDLATGSMEGGSRRGKHFTGFLTNAVYVTLECRNENPSHACISGSGMRQ